MTKVIRKRCNNCLQYEDKCICHLVDEFFRENKKLMEDLAELEKQEKKQTVRCVACYFNPCRCRKFTLQ